MLAQVADEYALDLEARRAIMGLLVRIIDEIRMGIREIDVDEIETLASI